MFSASFLPQPKYRDPSRRRCRQLLRRQWCGCGEKGVDGTAGDARRLRHAVGDEDNGQHVGDGRDGRLMGEGDGDDGQPVRGDNGAQCAQMHKTRWPSRPGAQASSGGEGVRDPKECG